MTDRHVQTGGSWVPEACTLPTTEQPLRLAEFDQFFADSVRGVDRLSAQLVRLRLDAAALMEESARDLTARESRTGGRRRGQPADRALLRAPGAALRPAALTGRAPPLSGRGGNPDAGHQDRATSASPSPRSTTCSRPAGTATADDPTAAGRHAPTQKLAEVEQKLADLTVSRDTLRAAISAGCDATRHAEILTRMARCCRLIDAGGALPGAYAPCSLVKIRENRTRGAATWGTDRGATASGGRP